MLKRKKIYLAFILSALVCLLYQSMPIHVLCITEHSRQLSLAIADDYDADSKEENNQSKKMKTEVDDFIHDAFTPISFISICGTIYYFHHLPPSDEVNTVFTPPPEFV